jgi:hypothetical protein
MNKAKPAAGAPIATTRIFTLLYPAMTHGLTGAE